MARIPDPPNQIIPNEIILHWRNLAGRLEVTPQFAHDLEVSVLNEQLARMGDRIIIQMQSRILAEKVHTETANVSFSKTVTPPKEIIDVPTQYDRCLPHLAGAIVCGVLAGFAGTVAGVVMFGVATVAFAVLACLTLYTERARILEVEPQPITVSFENEIEARYFNTFPKNTRVYPKELGNVVRMVELGEPDIRYFEQ